MTQSELTELTAITPLDGRYRSRVRSLTPYLSEFALMRYRVRKQCHWFLALAAAPAITDLPTFSDATVAAVTRIANEFGEADARAIKQIEATTNHDVKAVEYFVKQRLAAIAECAPHIEFVHFASTSEDVNNIAYALMLRDVRDEVVLPMMDTLIEALDGLAHDSADAAMLSRTHGQAASPTTMGKEMANVTARLRRCRALFANVAVLGKCNGAVGNYNAHVVAYPDADWPDIAQRFVEGLGLTFNPLTTQIEPHDWIAEYLHALARFNQVLLDFDCDVWSYISIGYFSQRKVEGETGSSTMPHKVNPIDFENSEGNIGVANALALHLAGKLQVSRWQRDLSDSTALRSIATVVGHSLVSYQATLKGMGKLQLNRQRLAEDLSSSWEVLAEAVQTVMRKHGMSEPYEQLKALTRGRQMDQALFVQVIGALNLPESTRQALLALTPADYTGIASSLAGLET